MMIRAAASLTLLAFGLATLSGCGSGHPAAAPAKHGTSPAATISAPPDAVRMSAFTQYFGTPMPASPAAARVVAGFREGMVLWGESLEDLYLVPPVTGYVVGDARKHLNTVLATEKSDKFLPAGSDRLWNIKIIAITAGSATLTSCDDGTKYLQENPGTGQTMPPSPFNQQYLSETWTMVPLDGHWAISSFALAMYPDHRAVACRPVPAPKRNP